VRIDRERVVAGVSCGEVLDQLSAYLDGELSLPERERLEGHLRGCEGCATFGGEFRATVQALRSDLLRPAVLPLSFRERLQSALETDRGRS
jgi:anti-sigma factor RsiW